MGLVTRVLLLFLSLNACGACAGDTDAPAITLRNIDGVVERHIFRESKLTMVHFWATWCAPCKKELPRLIRLSNRLRSRGLSLVLVAADSRKATSDYIHQYKLNAAVLIDQYGKAMYDYKIEGLPTTVMIDRSGRIVAFHKGMVDWQKDDIIARIERLLGD